eukprot:821245_1
MASAELAEEIKSTFSKVGKTQELVEITLSKPLSANVLSNQKELEDLGYMYDKQGYLKDVKGNKFKFSNQVQYDEVGNKMEKFIQSIMKTDYDMKEVFLPVGTALNNCTDSKSAVNNIFVSSNYESADVLVMIIQGSGAVRLFFYHCTWNIVEMTLLAHR